VPLCPKTKTPANPCHGQFQSQLNPRPPQSRSAPDAAYLATLVMLSSELEFAKGVASRWRGKVDGLSSSGEHASGVSRAGPRLPQTDVVWRVVASSAVPSGRLVHSPPPDPEDSPRYFASQFHRSPTRREQSATVLAAREHEQLQPQREALSIPTVIVRSQSNERWLLCAADKAQGRPPPSDTATDTSSVRIHRRGTTLVIGTGTCYATEELVAPPSLSVPTVPAPRIDMTPRRVEEAPCSRRKRPASTPRLPSTQASLMDRAVRQLTAYRPRTPEAKVPEPVEARLSASSYDARHSPFPDPILEREDETDESDDDGSAN
jgi:hypothetical protein